MFDKLERRIIEQSIVIWQKENQSQSLNLGWCVEVFGLDVAQELIFKVGEAAEEDSTAEHDDCAAPTKAIGPAVQVVFKLNCQVWCVFDWVDDQCHNLQSNSQEEKKSNHSQKWNNWWTQSHKGDNETHDKDDESNNQKCSCCFTPGVVHNSSTGVGGGLAALPEGGIFSAGLSLYPAPASQGDDIEDDGAEQEKGQDPFTPGIGDATLEHGADL